MKQLPLVFLFAPLFAVQTNAQLVTFNGQGGLLIPPGAPTQTVGITESPCDVSGVGIIGGCVTIEQVDLNMTHTFVGDIAIFLIGPGGQVLEFSSSNGGGGDNFTNTVFTDNAPLFITAGAPPFTGAFRPEGRVTNLTPPFSNAPPLGTYTFDNTFGGTDADGVWTLYINDYVAIDVGELISWSITFNLGGTAEADAGPDITICPGETTTLTASGGSTYQWSNGATTASTTVSPPSTQTYTVTVTEPGCGSDTDEVTVTVEPFMAEIFSSQPGFCPGGGTVELSAPEPGATYQWSTGSTSPTINVTNPGTYSVTVTTPSGCTGVDQVTLPVLAEPTISISLEDDSLCEGICTTVFVQMTGLPPFEFTWEFQQGGNPLGGSETVNTNGFTTSFQACPPGDGGTSVQVVICTLNDAYCPD